MMHARSIIDKRGVCRTKFSITMKFEPIECVLRGLCGLCGLDVLSFLPNKRDSRFMELRARRRGIGMQLWRHDMRDWAGA